MSRCALSVRRTSFGMRVGFFGSTHSLHYVYVFISIWDATSELVQLSNNNVLTRGKPTVTSFPNLQPAVSGYHTLHHFTHTLSYSTAGINDFRYLLLTVFWFKSLQVRYLLTYLLNSSMEHSPSWEANWFCSWWRNSPHFRNPKVPHRTHKRPPPVPILSQLHPVPTSWRFILILSSHLCLGLSNGLFPSGFPTRTLIHIHT